MASGKGVDDLPDELLLEIFSYVTTEELAMTVQYVSSRWKEVSQDDSLWNNRAFSPGDTTSDNEIEQLLRNMPKLKKFSPKRKVRTEYIIDTMCNSCTNIQQLEFTRTQEVHLCTVRRIVFAFPNLTHFGVNLYQRPHLPNFFTLIGQLNKLTTLDFLKSNVDIYKKVLCILADGCPSLQHIYLGYCVFDNEDIQYFLEKKRNQILSFSIRCYISTVTYISLSECTNLEYLEYQNRNPGLPHTYVHLFSKLSKMKNLTLSCYKKELSRNLGSMFVKNAMPYLIKLNINCCQNLEAQTLNVILRNCPGLKELIFVSTGLDGGFESIGTCSKLEKLTIQSTSTISDESFEHIGSGCHELKQLNVWYCGKVTDKAVEYICAGCPLLEELTMNYMDALTDDMFVHLFKCKNLRFIDISNNRNITGIHLFEIPTRLVHLETLHMRECVNVSKEHVENLQTKMPQLKIRRPWTRIIR